MRKVLIYTLLVTSVFASCSKEKYAHDETPDERINEKLTQYTEQLSRAAYGWKGIIEPAGGGIYAFYFKFDSANRVVMYSDFDSASSVTSMEASYRLKKLQQPSLIFDTYSYVTVLADPDASVNGGSYGAGLRSDFEFAIEDSTTADTIYLTGRFNGSKAYLVRATQDEEKAYNSGGMGAGFAFSKNYGQILQYWKTFTLNGITYQVNIDQPTRTAIVSWTDGSTQHISRSSYYFSFNGVELATPIVVSSSTTITGFYNIAWNANAKTISATVAGNSITIAGASKPAVVESNIAQTFRTEAISAGSYFINYEGIRVNGVNNAYGTDTLTYHDSTGGYKVYYMVYQPAGFSTTVDVFYPAFLDDAQTALTYEYFTLPKFSYKTDGRIVYTEYSYSLITPPSTGGYALARTWLYNTNGFYMVKLIDGTYDMVSAADATSWARWYLY